MIGKLGIGDAGIAATANTASGLASRAFSPDGDGYKDTLRLSWVNGRDLDALELRLIDPDGTVAGVVASLQRAPDGRRAHLRVGRLCGRLAPAKRPLPPPGARRLSGRNGLFEPVANAHPGSAARCLWHPHRHDEPDPVDECQPGRDLAQRRRRGQFDRP